MTMSGDLALRSWIMTLNLFPELWPSIGPLNNDPQRRLCMLTPNGAPNTPCIVTLNGYQNCCCELWHSIVTLNGDSGQWWWIMIPIFSYIVPLNRSPSLVILPCGPAWGPWILIPTRPWIVALPCDAELWPWSSTTNSGANFITLNDITSFWPGILHPWIVILDSHLINDLE